MKKWQKPEMTVVLRHNSEEAVLAACKSTWTTHGPNAWGVIGCIAGTLKGCSAIAAS